MGGSPSLGSAAEIACGIASVRGWVYFLDIGSIDGAGTTCTISGPGPPSEPVQPTVS